MNKLNRKPLQSSTRSTLTHRSLTRGALLTSALLLGSLAAYGCAVDHPDDQPELAVTAEVTQVSPVALKIEQAARILEREGDVGAAKVLRNQAMSASDITAEERIDAVVTLSRAHEAADDMEQAISLLEAEVANKSNPEISMQPLRERLAELLMPGKDKILSARPEQSVAPFAKLLAGYAQPDADGSYILRTIMSGSGDAQERDDVGTFNVQGALRAQREIDCPLCNEALRISSHVRQSNWLVIPEMQGQFDGAFLVFYFDLGRNRIPSRYERHLPLPVASIVAELEQGKSFAMVKERPGSPPAVLIAAPRTSMLWDVEQHLAGLEELPIEPAYVDVKQNLRPHEIRGVVRQQMLEPLRTCYDTLRQADAAAEGKIVLNFAVNADGAVEEMRVTASTASLDDTAFLSCVNKAASAMHFPKSGDRVTVKYPFTLNND